MLINNKLNKCKGCEGIQAAINELDCFIVLQGEKNLLNKRFSLNKRIEKEDFKNVIRYKNILIKRSYNPSYLSQYNITDIINDAKQLTY